MTKEQALKVLKKTQTNASYFNWHDLTEALGVAIEALEADTDKSGYSMSDLISRSDVVNAIDSMFIHEVNSEAEATWNKAVEIASNKIRYDLPSAQPEIIRCKDCKHWKKVTIDVMPNIECYICDTKTTKSEDDFCSRAKRREDD